MTIFRLGSSCWLVVCCGSVVSQVSVLLHDAGRCKLVGAGWLDEVALLVNCDGALRVWELDKPLPMHWALASNSVEAGVLPPMHAQSLNTIMNHRSAVLVHSIKDMLQEGRVLPSAIYSTVFYRCECYTCNRLGENNLGVLHQPLQLTTTIKQSLLQ